MWLKTKFPETVFICSAEVSDKIANKPNTPYPLGVCMECSILSGNFQELHLWDITVPCNASGICSNTWHYQKQHWILSGTGQCAISIGASRVHLDSLWHHVQREREAEGGGPGHASPDPGVHEALGRGESAPLALRQGTAHVDRIRANRWAIACSISSRVLSVYGLLHRHFYTVSVLGWPYVRR